MSTSTEFLFKKNSYSEKHKSPPRHFIPKSKSLEIVKPKIECQTYHIQHYVNDVTITVQTTPFLPQVGLFLSNVDKTFIIIEVNQNIKSSKNEDEHTFDLKTVEFDYHLLMSKIVKDQHTHKRHCYQETESYDDNLILSYQDIIKLFNGYNVHTFVVDVQGYKNINNEGGHFVISNKFKQNL